MNSLRFSRVFSAFNAMGALIFTFAWAAPIHANGLSEAYFTDKSPQLTPQERAAIDLAKKWQAANPTGVKPVAGPDGSIRFLFGSQQPSIVCAVLQVCDIELQAGEQVNSIHLGDQARWLVEPAVTGQGTSEVQHLIVKPLDVGLQPTGVPITCVCDRIGEISCRAWVLRIRRMR